MFRLIIRNEEKILATITDEQEELFSRYTDCVRAYPDCTLNYAKYYHPPGLIQVGGSITAEWEENCYYGDGA